ncbi:MAG: alcohol dehydrogenase class IV [Kiritimatiellia bacterium]|jgi:alcohol dehydrogenase class IV
MIFEFATAQRIIFGNDTRQQLGALVKPLGQHVFLVGGGRPAALDWAAEALARDQIPHTRFSVAGEPDLERVQEGLAAARAASCDVVVGIGGGSVIDAAKIISALLTNPGALIDYLEVIGEGRPLSELAAPFVALPTTAGTGAEVTRNGVIGSREHGVKVSMRSPSMLPNIALIDPVLTYSMPASVTASTGLDALTQLIEPYLSNLANPLTDGICQEGIRRVARSLRAAFHSGDPDAREDMAVAGTFGGLALANARLGAVHGFAGPIGGMFPAPHGMICARLLPGVMQANFAALLSREPGSPVLARFDRVAQWLLDDPTACAADGISWIQEICSELQVQPLAQYGISPDRFDEIIAKSRKASSMKGNPIVLSDAELRGALEQAVSD